jgi:hypothetical protein
MYLHVAIPLHNTALSKQWDSSTVEMLMACNNRTLQTKFEMFRSQQLRSRRPLMAITCRIDPDAVFVFPRTCNSCNFDSV